MNALVLVDIQKDFLPGGALAVPEGDRVVPLANRLMERFDLVVATQDWHPPDHGSFAASHAGHAVGESIDLNGLQQTLWPVHCVQESAGAAFAAELNRSGIDEVFRKGLDPGVDSYSAFYDNGRRRATGLGDWLRERGVETVYVMGLATEYCVRFTAIDAVHDGFHVILVEDGCRGVELQSGDVARALDEMRAAGVEIIRSSRLDPAQGEEAAMRFMATTPYGQRAALNRVIKASS